MSWFGESTNVPVKKQNQKDTWSREHLVGMMKDFFRELEPTFGGPGSSVDSFWPPINVAETDKSYLVETELPGVKKSDIQIDLSDDLLTIRGEKKSEVEEKNSHYYRNERSYGSFARTVRLPPGVDSESISAKMEEGVLRIEIGKNPDAAKKKAIVIN